MEIISNNAPTGVSNDYKDGLVSKVIKVDDNIDGILKRFNVNDTFTKLTSPIILRTGGIGDLIALSSISAYIPRHFNINANQMKFVSQEKYRSVFSWFQEPIQFVSYFAPVSEWKSGSAITRRKKIDNNKPIFYEGVIENSNRNWFNLQYEQIGITELDENYGRPMLKTERVSDKPSNIDTSKKSIMINPRSTAIIRSMRYEDIYNALIKIIADADVNIYVHARNLSDADKKFIILQVSLDPRIKIIQANSLDQFFLDSFDVDLTISVDTALLHFREGVEKPAVGIYGPFPFECRTKYYKFTHSFNLTSDCDKMPCFLHVKKPDEICDKQQQLLDSGEFDNEFYWTAPCCCQTYNTTVIEQLYTNMNDYILNSLNLN